MNDSEELWDKRYSDNPVLNPPSEFDQYLPTQGTCVDIAGGNGRNALWFAKKGYTTSVIDISSVALNQATKSAQSQKVELECIYWDIEKNLLPPERTWDIALLTLFLNRGVLQRHQHPSERFLLDPSEIFEISENLAGMEILHVDEGWRRSERHEAWLACKKII